MAGLHRPRLADPRRRRPRGLHRRLDVRRGPRTRARRSSSRSSSRSTRPRARCAAATPRMRRRRRPTSALRFPGKVASCRTGRSSSPTPHTTRSSTSRPDLATERPAVGRRRRVQRATGCARCCRPRPPREVGYDLLVADSVNHQVKGISLSDNDIRLVAGIWRAAASPGGRRARAGPGPLDAVGPGVVGRPGRHRHGRDPPALGADAGSRPGARPARGARRHDAGRACGTEPATTRGSPSPRGWRPPPTVSACGSPTPRRPPCADLVGRRRLRRPRWARACSTSATATGRPARRRLQHPLGVVELPDGSVAVCDTYNGAIRRFDPATNRVSTLAGGLAEPSDAVVEWADDGTARLVVVESAAHRLVRVAIPADAQEVVGPARQTQRPPTPLAAGRGRAGGRVRAAHRPEARRPLGRPDPAGRLGQPARAPARRRRGRRGPDPPAHRGDRHTRAEPCTSRCRPPPATATGENPPRCHLFQQDWGIPVIVDAAGPGRFVLDLRGT